MTKLKIQKYPVQHPLLKPFIKYIWHIDSDQLINLSHKWLPTNNIDLILNFAEPITYQDSESTQVIQGAHLNGIRQQYMHVKQRGQGNVFGISFFPNGLYPIFNIPMAEFTNRTILLENILPVWTKNLMETLFCSTNIQDKLQIIEQALISQLKNISTSPVLIKLNKTNGMSTRTLQRHFQKHVGVSPKQFQRITRFQQTLNCMLDQSFDQLSDLAYDFGYFDQAHFIHEFKSFSGSSPSRFQQENTSVKEIIIT